MQSKNTVRLSAAGSGKTWGICHDALAIAAENTSRRRILITTYTNKGVESIEREIKEQNSGVSSGGIVVRSWYTFLLCDLIRPYQSYITGINTVRSYDFRESYGKINYATKGSKNRYITPHGDVLSNYASELAVTLNSSSNGLVLGRLERVYSHVFIDEVQDLAGYDLDIIELLFNSATVVVCAGDGKQATYATHNTRKGRKQSGKNVWVFFTEAERRGKASVEYRLESRRFNQRICNFANAVFPNKNNISTLMKVETDHDGVFLILKQDVPGYYQHFKPVVLKHDKRTPTDGYPSLNFGQCKGLTFDRVLIYPNEPLQGFIKGRALKSPEKYYVAVTRPKHSIALVVDKFPNNPSYQGVAVILDGNMTIHAQRFVVGEV